MTDLHATRKTIERIIDKIGPLAAAKVLGDHSAKVAEEFNGIHEPSQKVLRGRGLVWPTISRGDRVHVNGSGGRVLSGNLSLPEQVEADRKSWRAGAEIRQQCLPILVADNGFLDRAWGVQEWKPEGKKWQATITRPISNEELIQMRSPYLIGEPLPTEGQTAFWPVTVDIDGSVYRAGKLVKVWDRDLNAYVRVVEDGEGVEEDSDGLFIEDGSEED